MDWPRTGTTAASLLLARSTSSVSARASPAASAPVASTAASSVGRIMVLVILVPRNGVVHVPPAAASPGRVPPVGGRPRAGLYAAAFGRAPPGFAERRKPPGGGFPLQAEARRFRSAVHSALARLETRVRLADHEDLAATTNDLAVAVTGLRRLQGGQDLHGETSKTGLKK